MQDHCRATSNLTKRGEMPYWNSSATPPWAELHEPIDRLFDAKGNQNSAREAQ
jgi:hypothetical protein